MTFSVELKGYDEFNNYIKDLPENSTTPTFFYFSGSKSDDGVSWCPDCVESEPIVKQFISEVKKEIIFAYVDVGDRPYFKDPNCPFRTDARTKLMCIPTVIKWKGVQRLEGSQCNKRDLLNMLMEDDE